MKLKLEGSDSEVNFYLVPATAVTKGNPRPAGKVVVAARIEDIKDKDASLWTREETEPPVQE